MADHNFKINLGINIKKGDSQKQLNDIRKKLEEKKIQLKVDTSKVTTELKTFKDSLNGIQKKLNDAFKLNKGQLQNLQDLKKVLSEINKLSKKTQIKISNGKDVTELVSNLENCKTKYTQLLKMKQSLEKQMAKTSNATAYKNLQEQLALVTKEAENCKTKISKLTELKLKTDMTKSMSSQFQAVQKQAQTLKNSLEKTLRNTNLASEQKKQLEQMLANVKTISQTRFRLKTSDAEAQLQKLLSDIEKIKKSYSNVKINIKATDNLNKATKSVNTFINKLKTAQNAKTGADAYINGTDLNKLITKAENLKQKLKSIKMTDNVGTETAKIIKELDTLKNKFTNLKNVAKLDMKLNGGASSLTKQIDTLTSKIQNMKNQKIGSDAFIDEGKLTDFITKLNNLKQNLNNLDVNDEKVVGEFEQIKNSVEKVDTEVKQLKADSKFELKLAQSQNQIDAMANRIDKLQQKAQKLGMTVPEIQQFRDRLVDIAKLPLGEQAVALGKLGNEITKTSNKMTALGSATKRTQTFFSNLYSSMSTYSLGNIISMQMTKAIYGISDTIRELDKAFVNLNKVAPDSFHGTAEEFDALREKAISVGQDVARSSVDIINSTASALQLGIDNMDKAMEYAKNVNMYANVADISEEESDKYIKSIMSAYGGVNQSLDEMKDKVKGAGDGYSMLTNYMDMANYAGNNFALTSADVGEALSKTSSAMASNGVALNEGIGLIIGAQESVQNASKVGNSFKTMINRLNGVTYSMKEGKIIANKTAQAFKELAGIEIVDWNTNKVEDAYTIFSKLAEKWDSMNDVQKNGIADALGGAHHLNTLQALMNNWDTVVRYQQEYNDGWMVGSAEKEKQHSPYVQKCA